MSASAWIPLITAAIEAAIHAARSRGLPAPSDDAIEEIAKAANDATARILPASMAALSIMVAATAAKGAAQIASLGTVERCTRCGGVATIHNGDAGRFTTCDNCDGLP